MTSLACGQMVLGTKTAFPSLPCCDYNYVLANELPVEVFWGSFSLLLANVSPSSAWHTDVMLGLGGGCTRGKGPRELGQAGSPSPPPPHGAGLHTNPALCVLDSETRSETPCPQTWGKPKYDGIL